MAYTIHYGHLRFRMLNVRRCLQSGFSSRKSLKEVCPECPAVRFAHAAESWAELRYLVTHCGRDELFRQRFLNSRIPLWAPCIIISQHSFLFSDGGRRRGL